MKAEMLTEIVVPLAVPVPVRGQDGKEALRARLTLRRPKTRHAKRLAALIGADLVVEIVGQAPAGAHSVDGRRLVADLLPKLMTAERLEALTAILADMCDEDPAVIDELDPVDLVRLGKAFLGFFPALRSLGPGASPPS